MAEDTGNTDDAEDIEDTDDLLTGAAIERATRAYYDARPIVGDAWDAEPAGDLADPRPELRRLEEDLRRVVRGRRVLEVACGTGALTRVAAEVKASVLAIDASETCIRLARERAVPGDVRFEVGDAYDLAALPADFSAALAGGFFHLVPRRRRGAFLDGLESRLLPGSPVFLCATRARTLRAKKRAFPHPDGSDTLSRRQLADGRAFVIVNNELDASELRELFGPRGRDLQVVVGDAFWWVSYTI